MSREDRAWKLWSDDTLKYTSFHLTEASLALGLVLQGLPLRVYVRVYSPVHT